MKKIKCALIGSGNIGTDLIYKLQRSPLLEPVWMVGIDPESEGLARARDMGLKTTADGVDGLLPHVLADGIQIAFDATSAYVHAEKVEMNVNMISCAGQATIPIVYAVSSVQPVGYGEIVASLASKSIGPGTRANLDEFTYTTSNAIEIVGGARKGKALAIINPADPPMMMRNTISCLTDDEPDQERITASVLAMIKEVQKYVPGYRLVNGPLFDGKRVTVFMEVAGLGDYLPKYAGNLDIMTAAATRTAEMFAEEILAGSIQLKSLEVA